MSQCVLRLHQLILSQIHHSIHISVSSPAVFYLKFTTQFMSQCLLQLVLSQIHHSIHVSMSSSACSIPNSPLDLYLGVFSGLFYHMFTCQFSFWSHLPSQTHCSIHLLVFSPACSITHSLLNSQIHLSILMEQSQRAEHGGHNVGDMYMCDYKLKPQVLICDQHSCSTKI